jgi:hypothetical protein
MTDRDLARWALEAFRDVASVPPPLTLRGGGDLDDYRSPHPFNPAIDAPTDEYLERHAFIGVGYLDAISWRHYLPCLIEYALLHPTDPAMVTEALVASLRPPDRYPPRLGSLNAEQEDVVRSFLEALLTSADDESIQRAVQQALEEWWWPHPRSRPTAAEIEALRRIPTTYRPVSEAGYRLQVPDALTSSGVRLIPSESREVQTWGGYVCGDVHALIAVNVLTQGARTLDHALSTYLAFFGADAQPTPCAVSGASRAMRVDANVSPGSPADPHALIIIVAEAADVVALTIRAHDRRDVREVMAHVAASFALT